MSRKDIGKIVELTENNAKSVFANPIVTIVIIAVIILPSLYALINIEACWDPYEKTSDVPFAIANLDNGTTLEGQKLNIGNELVKELKNNTKFDWTFVTEDELRDGVNTGKYYAGIVIPKNLSENIASITGDNPKQAKLEYVVNIKANPVANRLTDAGANAVYTSLNAKIVELINLAAYEKLGELQSGLAAGASQLSSGGSQLQAGADQVSAGASQVSDGASQIKEGSKTAQSHVPEIESGAKEVSSGSEKLQQGAEELQETVDPSLMPDGPIKQYTQGTSDLANGSSALADGSVDLAQGSAELAQGASYLAGNSSLLADGSVSLAAGAELLSSAAAQALFTASAGLASSADALAAITGINETTLGDYFFAPIKLDRHEVYPVPDYGSGVSPFYIVLSMWVGALITCVLMPPKSSEGTPYSPFEMYAGNLLLYVTLSILQAFVTITGAHILGVHIDNYPLFILSATLVSVVFMTLIYSIVSA
ncbi:YhgE/Pip domain-containing protein, partial [Methanobrevibacter sp. UBA188]|uniref:YhgE/Pip domain-containing protein n=1 Tax=Methanobrevibacter sp. UBA188 TaxID=1915473 RepID=UPI0025F7FF90